MIVKHDYRPSIVLKPLNGTTALLGIIRRLSYPIHPHLVKMAKRGLLDNPKVPTVVLCHGGTVPDKELLEGGARCAVFTEQTLSEGEAWVMLQNVATSLDTYAFLWCDDDVFISPQNVEKLLRPVIEVDGVAQGVCLDRFQSMAVAEEGLGERLKSSGSLLWNKPPYAGSGIRSYRTEAFEGWNPVTVPYYNDALISYQLLMRGWDLALSQATCAHKRRHFRAGNDMVPDEATRRRDIPRIQDSYQIGCRLLKDQDVYLKNWIRRMKNLAKNSGVSWDEIE